MARRLLIGSGFAAVLLLLVAAVSLPAWAHPMSADEAVAIARAQPGLNGLEVSDASLSVTVDGRVFDRRGTLVYRRPGPSIEAGPVALGLPQAYWVVQMQTAGRACTTATVVIDAGSRKVVATRRQSFPCRRV